MAKSKKTKKKKTTNNSLRTIVIGGCIALLIGTACYLLADTFYGSKPEPSQVTRLKTSLKEDKGNQAFISQQDATDGITTYKNIKEETITVQHTEDYQGTPIVFQTKIQYPSSRKNYWLYTQPTTLQLNIVVKSSALPLQISVMGVKAKAYTISNNDTLYQHLTLGNLNQINPIPSDLADGTVYNLPWNIYELSASKEVQQRQLDIDDCSNEANLQQFIQSLMCEIQWIIQIKNTETNQVIIKTLQDMIQFKSKP